MPISIFAHVKWFSENPRSIYENPIHAWEFMAIIFVAVILLFVLSRVESVERIKSIYQIVSRQLQQYSTWIPSIVRYVTAAMLLLNVSQQYLLAPNMPFDGSSLDVAILASFSLAGLMMLVGGVFIRPGAVIMLMGYLLVFAVRSPADAFDHLEYIGLAGYLLLAGERDSFIKGLVRDKSRFDAYGHYAGNVLRVSAGAGLMVLAFSEKLFNIGLSEAFLTENSWNVLSFAGVSDRSFTLFAGMIELMIGASLIFNIATRLTTLMLLGVMSLTAVLLGLNEIIGHLFAIAVIAVVWIPPVKRSGLKKSKVGK